MAELLKNRELDKHLCGDLSAPEEMEVLTKVRSQAQQDQYSPGKPDRSSMNELSDLKEAWEGVVELFNALEQIKDDSCRLQ
jgi:hypothetical protein